MIRDFGATGAYASTGSNEKLDGVTCDVSNCYYHEHGNICTAEHIKVGPTNAASSDDTVCATFKPQK